MQSRDEAQMHYTKSKKSDSVATYSCMILYAQFHFYNILEMGKKTDQWLPRIRDGGKNGYNGALR